MAKLKRKVFIDDLGRLSPYDLDLSLEELRVRVDELIAEHGSDAFLDLEWDYDNVEYFIRRRRNETDEELTARQAAADKRAAAKQAKMDKERAARRASEASERAEYERLKAKYG